MGNLIKKTNITGKMSPIFHSLSGCFLTLDNTGQQCTAGWQQTQCCHRTFICIYIQLRECCVLLYILCISWINSIPLNRKSSSNWQFPPLIVPPLAFNSSLSSLCCRSAGGLYKASGTERPLVVRHGAQGPLPDMPRRAAHAQTETSHHTQRPKSRCLAGHADSKAKRHWECCAATDMLPSSLSTQIENLLISNQGTIKLCDFGSATTVSHYPDYSWSAQKRSMVEDEVGSRQTHTHTYRGKPWVFEDSKPIIKIRVLVWYQPKQNEHWLMYCLK